MAIFPKQHKNRTYMRRKSIRMTNYAFVAGGIGVMLMFYEVLFNKEQMKKRSSSDQVFEKINQPIIYHKALIQDTVQKLDLFGQKKQDQSKENTTTESKASLVK